MFSNFNNFGASSNISYKYLYQRNKLLVWLMLISLAVMISLKTDFFDVFWTLYLSVFSAYILRNYFTEKNILTTFLLGFVSGLLVFLLFFDVEKEGLAAIGVAFGSGAYALLTRLITYAPKLQVKMLFFGVIQIVWIGLILIAIDILTINPSHLNVRFIHVGGMLYGFLSIYLLKNNALSLHSIKRFFKSKKTSKKQSQRPVSDEEFNKRKKDSQDEIDRILEKIKHRGYESLNADEKRKLFEKSQS